MKMAVSLAPPVITGTRLEDRVQILSGLAPGEIVVTSGVLQLSPGQNVRPLSAN